jgi:integrase
MAGQVIPRGDRKWLLRVYAGRDGGGKRIYVNKTFSGTFSQAEKEMHRMQAAKDTKTLVVPVKANVAAFLRGWLTSRTDLTPRSQKQYASIINAKINPLIGGIRLTSLEVQHVQRMVNTLGEQGLGPATIACIHRVLHAALEHACRWHLLHRNPSDHITRPKIQRTLCPETIYSADEVQVLIKAATKPPVTKMDHRLGPLWVLLVGTGLRPGEAAGLKWSDVSLEADAWVSVHRTSVMGKIVEGVKTQASQRHIALPVFVVNALKAHRVEQAKTRLRFGPNYEDQGLVFCTRLGRPLDVDDIAESWNRFVKRNKLRRITLYHLRHTHATLLLTKGSDIRLVSARLGHSDISITARVYAQVTPEAHRSMASVLDAAVNQ